MNRFFIYGILLLSFVFCFTPSPVCSEQGKGEDFTINYKEFLKDKGKLGFSPDFRLFKAAYVTLKSKYVNLPDDGTLLSGVKKEVGKLLKAAGSNASFNPRTFAEVSLLINSLASAKLPASLLWYSAISGMLFSLEDPYTLLLTPADYSALMEQMESASFGGVGLYLDADKNNANRITVFEPIEGTPAYRAGLMPEDVILAINSESTVKMPVELAVKKMRGNVGTVVTLKVKRKGEANPLIFKLKRENIRIHSVSCKIIDKSIGYIRVRSFGENTGSEFAKAMEVLASRNVHGIIIDLRNNGGGLINAAIDLGNVFLENGRTIVSVEPRSGSRHYIRSERRSHPPALPVLILINKYSASASEIFSGAMQDYGLAVIMGGKSYGKGSVQEVIPLSSGAGFKLTVAHYLTPKGRNIDKKGIMPDIKNEMDVKLVGRGSRDTQLRAAVNYLRAKR